MKSAHDRNLSRNWRHKALNANKLFEIAIFLLAGLVPNASSWRARSLLEAARIVDPIVLWGASLGYYSVCRRLKLWRAGRELARVVLKQTAAMMNFFTASWVTKRIAESYCWFSASKRAFIFCSSRPHSRRSFKLRSNSAEFGETSLGPQLQPLQLAKIADRTVLLGPDRSTELAFQGDPIRLRFCPFLLQSRNRLWETGQVRKGDQRLYRSDPARPKFYPSLRQSRNGLCETRKPR